MYGANNRPRFHNLWLKICTWSHRDFYTHIHSTKTLETTKKHTFARKTLPSLHARSGKNFLFLTSLGIYTCEERMSFILRSPML